MKLRHIVENIEKSDFYDFYALLYAYQDGNHSRHDEIASHLRFMSSYILRDHLLQIGKILINRLPDAEDEETIALLAQHNITQDGDTYELHGLDSLKLDDVASIIVGLVNLGRKHGFTGDTWLGLGKEFLALYKTPDKLGAMILAIDKIYNMLHHGGQLTDYMDENNWLEDSLNIRDNANPAQIFAQASSQTRALIGRSNYSGQDRGQISELKKLYTALRRAASGRHQGVKVDMAGDRLIITVPFSTIIATYETDEGPQEFEMPMPAYNGQIPERKQTDTSARYRLGQSFVGRMTVREEPTRLMISNGKTELPVNKPINRQYHLAVDIILAAVQSAKDRPFRIGSSISDIKPSYYYVNGRRKAV